MRIYEPQQNQENGGERVNIPDGTYTIDQVEILSNCMTDEGPCLVPSNGENKLFLRFKQPNGEDGPAWSGNIGQFILLVQDFGAFVDPEGKNSFALTCANRDTSLAILVGVKVINASKKVLKVQSQNGWAKGPYSKLPEGKYTFKFVDAVGGENHTFKDVQGRNGSYQSMRFIFEVVGDGTGNPSIYEGCRISTFMSNPFKESFIDEEGITITAVDVGEPLAPKSKAGIAWKNFEAYFAPSMANHVWSTDINPLFGFSELDEPQTVIIQQALADNRTNVLYVRHDGQYANIDLQNLPMFNELPTIAQQEEQTAPAYTVQSLLDYIMVKWADVGPQAFFESATPTEVLFSESGAEWARKHLIAPMEQAGISTEEPRKALHELSGDECEALLEAMKSLYGEA